MTRSRELASLPLSERIAALISDAQTNQDGFAAKLGAPYETVSRWLNRHAKPGRDYRQKLADIATEVWGEPVSPDLFRPHVDPQMTVELRLDQLIDLVRGLESVMVELLDEIKRRLPAPEDDAD